MYKKQAKQISLQENPISFTGYKVYDEDGCQIVLKYANELIKFINKDEITSVKTLDESTARNRGLLTYVGQNVVAAFLNAIVCQAQYMELHQNIGLLSPLILNEDHTIQYLCKLNPTIFDMMIRWISPRLFSRRQDRHIMKNTGYDKIMGLEYASGCFKVFRTDNFKRISGFDENYFMYLEDADITRRINAISPRLSFSRMLM